VSHFLARDFGDFFSYFSFADMTAFSTSDIVVELLSHFEHSVSETSFRNCATASSKACRAGSSPLKFQVRNNHERALHMLTSTTGLQQTIRTHSGFVGRESCSKVGTPDAGQQQIELSVQPLRRIGHRIVQGGYLRDLK
jgi:hypothetical protein